MEDRITELYNPGFFEQLLPVEYSDGDYTISGYAGLPQTGRKDRQDQYLFVNGRPATAPVVYHALNEAYHSLIAKGRYPAVFLFIAMEPSLVDVNVHPTKKEVRFRRPNQLRDAVVAALQSALSFQESEVGGRRAEDRGQASGVGGDDGEQVVLPPPSPVRPKFETQKQMDDLLVRPEIIQRSEGRGQRAGVGGQKSEDRGQRSEGRSQKTEVSAQHPLTPSPPHPTAPASQQRPRCPDAEDGVPPPSLPQTPNSNLQTTSPWGWCRIVGRIGENYVVLETEDGFVLMEPRAAHERVLFERFMAAAHEHAVKQQGLLAPETIDLLPSDAQIVRDHIDVLQELGFGVSEFGGDTFIVDALPVYVQDGPAESLLVEIARALEKAGKKRAARELVQERVAQAACQTAVRMKDRLSDQEIEELVAGLARTEMPYTSPRGRPTLIYTSFTELNRKFSRD